MIRTAGPGHLEDRTMSSACNPYLAFSAYVSAGMDGIENNIDPGKANFDNTYALGLDEISRRGIEMLPQSLLQAIEELKRDEVIQKALDPIYDEFVKVKEQEWLDYHRQVSSWEVDRYLTMF